MHLCGVFMSYSKTWIVCATVSSCFVQETSFATVYKWQTKMFISWDLKQSLVWKVPFPPLLFSILSFSLALVYFRFPKCLGLYFLKCLWRLADPLKPLCLWQKIHNCFTHKVVMGCLVVTDLTWILKNIYINFFQGGKCRKFSFNVPVLHRPIFAIINKCKVL